MKNDIRQWCMRGVQLAVIVLAMLPAVVQPASSTERLKQTARKYYYGIGVGQDYARALALYLEAARLGDAEAQFIAGGMYFVGRGSAKNPREAFRLLYQAAINGKSSPESQKIIGQTFLVGQVVPKNYPEAVRWYQEASENGDRDAQNELGFMYVVGNGVGKDPDKAFKMFEQSARSGLAIAQYNLGIMLSTGNGVEQADLAAAYAWFNMAAANGFSDAVAARASLETVLSPQELERAQRMSDELFRQINLVNPSAAPGK